MFFILTISAVSKTVSRYYIQFDDSTIILSKGKNSEFPHRLIRKEVNRLPHKNKIKRIEQILDSIGFFCLQSDTLSDNSIKLYPGKRAIVRSETIHDIDSVYLERLPKLHFPRPYNAAEYATRAKNLTTILAENGYPFAAVSLALNRISPCSNDSRDTFSIDYHIRSDDLYVNEQPNVFGNEYTNKRLILNDILIRPGAVYNYQKQLDSQLRLRSRSYIADVEIFPPEIIRTNKLSDSIPRVITPFRVVDKSGIGFDGAAGVAGNPDQNMEFNGKVEFTLLNVFHTGEFGTLGYAGDSRQQRLDMHVSKPWFFNLPFEITLEGGLEVVKNQYGFIHGNMKILTEIGAIWRTGINFEVTETTASTDSIGYSGHFYGASLIISEKSGAYTAQQFGHKMKIDIGSGVSNKDEKYARTQFNFEAGIHIPLFLNQAVVSYIRTFHLVTDEQKLLPAEMFRLGGNNSLRGYADDEYAFRTALNGQLEYTFYVKGLGAAYIFTDGVLEYASQVDDRGDNVKLMGYGIGVNVPSKFGTMTLEWARNIQDWRSLGRIHIRYRNSLW